MRELATRSYDAGSLLSQDLLPYRFRNERLFLDALTAGDSNSADREGHRSLAQLGDSLIGFVIMSEGFDRRLSRQEQQIASSYYRRKDVCTTLARARCLDQVVRISDRQMHEGPQPTVLKNLLAALVGAVWADSRSYVAVRQVMASLGLVNDIDPGVDPSNIMLSRQMYPQPGSGSLGTCEVEMLDWDLPDPVDGVQQVALLEAMESEQQFAHDFYVRDTSEAATLSSDILSSPSITVLTPASVNDDTPATAFASSLHEWTRTSESDRPAPSISNRAKGYQGILDTYVGREVAKLGDPDTFSQLREKLMQYQRALRDLELSEAQKKTAAKIVTAFGDCSALLMLKKALLEQQPVAKVEVLGISDRLRVILSLECSAVSTRLLYWLHLCELLEELDAQVSAEEDSGSELSGRAHGGVKKFGNPQNQRRSRLSQLMLSYMPPEYATETKAKRLRRIAQRMTLLVERWKSYGVLALLGADFNTLEMMTLPDPVYKQILDLVWTLEGEKILRLGSMAENVVRMVRDGSVCGHTTTLEISSDDHILSLPRLSAGMEDMFEIVS